MTFYGSSFLAATFRCRAGVQDTEFSVRFSGNVPVFSASWLVHAASVVWGRARRRQRQWPFVVVLLADGDMVVFGCNSGFWTAPSLSPVRKPCASGPCWAFSTTGSLMVSGPSQLAGCRLAFSGCNGEHMDNVFAFAEEFSMRTEASFSSIRNEGFLQDFELHR